MQKTNQRRKSHLGRKMMLQSTIHKKDTIDLSSAPWTMHEFFAGSGLVAYGLKGMIATVWANDISEQKAAVYEANLGNDHFKLGDIKDVKGTELPFAHLSWASFPCQDLSLAGSMGGIHAARSGLVWEWLRVLDEMTQKPKILLLENVPYALQHIRNVMNRNQLCIAPP
ncbi:DNA cytosine methyltransferase [Dysosmobacter welbionis]|uniref:DNA cytosine methyltransferase n=1 Tax=Dysosmobacter welbionis TaxID=2093857 RepID=UPI002109C162|nr:DNA cytosine methyltransferase [Dysosmobacter welbionis]MCQ5042519.1 DNA cytosine methyltransferase [Dysosmobacter welbionis]